MFLFIWNFQGYIQKKNSEKFQVFFSKKYVLMIMIEHVKMMQILDLDMANAYSWTSAS